MFLPMILIIYLTYGKCLMLQKYFVRNYLQKILAVDFA